MFQVEYKNEIRTVYHVYLDNLNKELFLTYDYKKNKWEWIRINETKPYCANY